EIIGSVLHLDRRPEEYAETLHAILDAGGAPVPHLTVGFGSRDLIGSAEAVKEAGLSRVVLLGLVPTPGTVFSSRSVSEAEMISAVDVLSGMGLEATLGCMRDRSHRSLERECILRGVKGIANMSRETLRWAERNGYSVSESRTCCCCAGPQNIESVFSERYP
ncbi:MAG: hypothetical protein LBT41_05500, partial [Candidatus Methanoplasma sp.]|nr:hypothetical protein [Candidatus Methanoplasma sp.]